MVEFSENELIVASSPEEFDRISSTLCSRVVLVDDREQSDYERLDGKLAELVGKTLTSLMPQTGDEEWFHQILDWWPTKTRFVEIGRTVVNRALLGELQCLLVGVYSDWTVNLQVYESMGSDAKHLGSINIYSDKILLLYNLLELVESKE